MATIEVLQLRCRSSGRWVIWNHQTYLLAHHPGEICMGCLVQVSHAADVPRVLDLARGSPCIGPYADLEVVPVQVRPPPRWCVPTATWRAPG